MMLLIDTTDNEQIALTLIGKDAIARESWAAPSAASEVLPQKIQKFLKTHKTPLQKLKKLGVNVGPGHFSRVRTGVATANALAFALKIPVVSVKKSEIDDLGKVFSKKGSVLAKPYYDKAPNISKPKHKKLKI